MMQEYNSIKDLISVFKMQEQSVSEMYTPYFYTYLKNYFSNPDRLIRKLNEMKSFASKINSQPNTTSVLIDLGCGFGLESIMLSIITKNMKIIGIDHNEEKIRIAKKLAEQSKVHDIDFILQSGENLSKELEADIILCRDVVSHVNDINTFFDSIVGILKLNGILYVIDDRNALNPLIIWQTKLLQKKAEKGEIELGKLREIDPKKNFFEIRKEIIQGNFKYMEEGKVNKYAQISAGLFGNQIISFIESTEKGRKLKLPKFKYVNPITGESYERLYNPFYIKGLLEGKGLRVIIDKPFFSFSKRDKSFKKIMASIIQNLHPISLLISPVYHIKAQKI